MSIRLHRKCSARQGFSLLELSISIVIMLIAIGSLCSTVLSTSHLARANEEKAIADSAAKQMAATMRATPFAQIFATFNTDPNDDPLGIGTGVGAGFAVEGLTPQADDADGFVGRIVFPTVPAAIAPGLELREDVVDAGLGMPRDLNGDGLDAANHAGNYIILPVTIFIEWVGPGGNSRLELNAILLP